MNLYLYLQANNVALIDPEQPFHAECIKHFTKKGFLSKKQLAELREWGHSQEKILKLAPVQNPRLIGEASINTPSIELTPFDEGFVPVIKEPINKKPRWTAEELTDLVDMMKNHLTLGEMNSTLGRTTASIKAKCHKLGATFKRDKVIWIDEEKLKAAEDEFNSKIQA